VRHLLVTNDFPPKTGGIQSYLWELWRRLPPDDVVVYTTPHSRAARFDGEQPFRIIRSREPVLLPNPLLAHRVRALAREVGAEAVVLDPALPLGLIGPGLGLPYATVLHGAEVTVPGRLPATRSMLSRVLTHASLVIAAGSYPEAEARRAAGRAPLPPVANIPPGVDVERFVPLPGIERAAMRARLGLDPGARLVVSVSRLVPRKGMDTLIEAAARLTPQHPDLQVAIGGTGRDERRLARLAERSGLVVFSDEIYDQMVYDEAQFVPMATLVEDTLCATLSGLSKVYRACGYRVGWAVFSGRTRAAAEYLSAIDLLSSLRLCSNVLAQWAVQTALGGYQSIGDLIGPGGRLYESRAAIARAVGASQYLRLKNTPQGAMYAFIGVDTERLPGFDDQRFALDLLEQKHVLVAPGVSFNVPYRNHFRVTTLPDSATLLDVFGRIEDLLAGYASAPPQDNVVSASARFK